MCGILGSINCYFNENELNLIKHRGPDDFGLDEFSIGGNKVTLAQRRLSIIDLSPAGHQPMISSCGNYAIIFNGEIYNHEDLRNSLSGNIAFRGHSDTESILYYLIQNGRNGLKDLNGIFALAFLDIKNSTLLLARDPFGVKPLYYYKEENNQIIFSSEIRPIKQLIGNTSLNKPALATLLRLRYNPAPETLYEGIYKLQPGHLLEIEFSNDDFAYSHCSFIEKLSKPNKVKTDAMVEKYGIALEAAVKRQLLSDVEVGILLSGGIDSALVACLAQRHYKGKLKAFTIGFEGTHNEDEIADAAKTAEILGLEHFYKKITFNDFLGLLKKCADIVEEPLATTSMIPMYYLSELASEKVKVVLTGQGADEPLGGYTRYKLELIRNKFPAILLKTGIPLTKNLKFSSEQLSRGIKAMGIKNTIARFLTTYETFTADEIRNLIATEDKLSVKRISYYYDLLNCKELKDSVEQMMAIDLHLNLADDLLNYTDKITMYHGLECRVPMLDLELVKFIQSLPVKLKLNIRGGKIIHKKFAEQLLPGEIIQRKKKGFQSPTHLWFKQEKDSIKEILLSEDGLFAQLFNKRYVAKIINEHQSGVNREKQIFLLLNIFYFLESYSKWLNESKVLA